MGHRDLLVTQNLSQPSSNTAPLASRVASAAGRLRSNELTSQVGSGTHMSDLPGGFNGSMQHSARTGIALKTRAKSAPQGQITQNAILARFSASRAKQLRFPGEVLWYALFRWCCVDRLNRQGKPEMWVLERTLTRIVRITNYLKTKM